MGSRTRTVRRTWTRAWSRSGSGWVGFGVLRRRRPRRSTHPTRRRHRARESATRDLPPERAETHDVNRARTLTPFRPVTSTNRQTLDDRSRTWLSDSPRPRASRRSRPARAHPPVAPPRRRRSRLARSVTPRAFSPATPSSPTPSSVAVTRASPTPARGVASSWRPRLRGTSSSRSRRGRRRRRRPSVRRSVPRCAGFSRLFLPPLATRLGDLPVVGGAPPAVQPRSGGWRGDDGREGVLRKDLVEGLIPEEDGRKTGRFGGTRGRETRTTVST